MTLEARIAAAAANGLDELVVRVSRYGDDGPEAYQAIAKHRRARDRSWGVGVRSNPVSALNAALDEFEKRDAPQTDGGVFG